MDTLFFITSKIMQFFIEPLNWVFVFVVLSLLFLNLRKSQLCKYFLLLALVDLILVGWLPTSEVFLRTLEDRVPKTDLSHISPKDIGGIIILGGVIEGGEISLDRGEISIGSAAERVTKAFELIRKHPDLPFIFSGFSDSLSPKGIPEADAFKQLVAEQGLPTKSAHYENQSRNTYENVLYFEANDWRVWGKKYWWGPKAMAFNYFSKSYVSIDEDFSKTKYCCDSHPSRLSNGK